MLFGNSTINNNFLNLDTYYKDNKLFILNKDKSISDKEIVKIGNINIYNIFNTVDDYITSENISGERINKSIYSLNYKILEIAGANIENNALNVEIKEIDKTFNENVKFVEKDTYSVYENNSEIRSKNIDYIYYIKMNVCELNDSLEEEAKKLEDEIKKGRSKIIIDLRNNPGGDSRACSRLIEAMGMKEPSYGVFIRNSKLLKNTYPKENNRRFGNKKFKANKNTAKRNDKINLVLLTSEYTFSSANMFVVFVQDGNLGKIIGVGSSNKPSSYGDVLN